MTDRSTLMVSLYGGIGNRIKPLLTSRELASATGRQHRVYWKRDHRFQAKLDHLWYFDADYVGFLRNAYVSRAYPTVKTGQAVLDLPQEKWVNVSHHDPIQFEGQTKRWEDLFKDLIPNDSIQNKIRSLLATPLLADPYVGVMVRAHNQSHPQTKSTSPVSWFVDRLKGIAEAQPGISFYLSCDDPSTQNFLRNEIPNIVSLEKEGRYNSTAGVQEAVVDLYLLAHSSYLIGPAWSTFVHMADALRVSPQYEAETPLTEPKEPVNFGNLSSAKRLASVQYPWTR